MAIQDDIRIDANGDIRYTGAAHGAAGAGYYSVIELHRFLQDLADDAVASGDDLLDITATTPSERSTDNIITLLAPYNIDDELAEHLFDGSIIQAGGDVIYDGLVIIAAEGMDLQIVQSGALISNDFWNEIPDTESTKGLNRDVANGISHRFMIKVRNGGTDINGRRLLGQTRVWGFTYSEFPINGTARGNNVMALQFASDLNNQTAVGTVATWTEIANLTEGYIGIDVTGNGSDEFFYSRWDLDVYSKNQFYERMKWLSRQDSSSTLYGLNGELFRGITHEIDVGSPSGTFNNVEPISWATGTGQLLAINSVGSPTKMWLQLLTGTAPVNGQTITGTTSTATAVQSGAAVERPVSRPFVGASTGSAIIGAYGFGIQAANLSAADLLFDLGNTPRQPPNNVTFTVFGLEVGDRVLVGPASGGLLNTAQLAADGSQVNQSTLIVESAIPLDTPPSGTVRVFDGDTFARLQYTSYSGSTFTLSAATGFTVGDGADVFISYIDLAATGASASFTGVYQANRDLFVRVRNGGVDPIKTFETTGVLGPAGGSATAIRTSDE
jgi:hypothetical protein